MRPLGDSQTVTWNPTQDEDYSDSSDKQGVQLNRRNSLDKNIAFRDDVEDSNPPTTSSVLSRAPTNFSSQDEIVNGVVDLTDRAVSIALFGSVGTGKSFVALNILHHYQTKAKFGQNRYFMRCDDLKNSLEGFLVRLSDTVQTDVAQLRSHLQSAPLILLLDGVDSILDPLTPQFEEICATIEEFGNYEHVCLVTTSRMNLDIHGFHQIEVPTLSGDEARDTFYNLCSLPRSSRVDSLIATLDLHPLAIELLASCVRENDWDEPTFLKAWDDDQTSLLKTSEHRRLRDAIEPVPRSSMISRLGTTAQDVLGEIAASPYGVKECELKEMAGTGEAVDVLCKSSLVYRKDGIVKIFAPVRSYFLESAVVPAQREEELFWDVGPMPGACMSSSFHLFHGRGVT